MNDKEWTRSGNIYEVNIRQYTKEGTFNAFAEHLPRLKDMGVQILWLMPITPISHEGRKGSLGSYYACSSYTQINPEFGTLDDFKNLVYKAHGMGFKIIIDWVANHTGWDHHWTKENPEWYKKDEYGNFKKAAGMDDIIELDFNQPALRNAMTGALKYWLYEVNIDGFRCDLAFWVQQDYWLEAIPQLNAIKPLFWLGELDPLEHPEYMQVFDAAYTWTWMHKTEDYVKGNFSFHELNGIQHRYLERGGLDMWFTSNHDENTWNGSEYEKYGDRAKGFAVQSFTWPGIPMIYSGQELPNLKRLQFFEKDEIEWRPECELHTFYQKLAFLKSNHKALCSDAGVHNFSDAEQEVLAFRRKSAGDAVVMVLINLSGNNTTMNVPDDMNSSLKELFTEEERDFSGNKAVTLAPYQYVVFSSPLSPDGGTQVSETSFL